MTDPVPSKERDIEQMESLAGVANGTRDPRDYDIRTLADFAITRIERLRTALRGIQSCSTCERCRGAATLALGGAAPEPAAERCKHGNPIDPTGSYVCLKCFNEPAGFCCDINASHPGKHRDGCPAQPPGDGQQ
jgi:hypothetical protein